MRELDDSEYQPGRLVVMGGRWGFRDGTWSVWRITRATKEQLRIEFVSGEQPVYVKGDSPKSKTGPYIGKGEELCVVDTEDQADQAGRLRVEYAQKRSEAHEAYAKRAQELRERMAQGLDELGAAHTKGPPLQGRPG